jgi:uncharacterized protein
MLIQHKQEGDKGLFFVGLDGAIQAELVYHLSKAGNMVIEHTQVDSSLAGKGVGKQLVETAVAFARTNQIKIIPLCPFANALFKRIPEWSDVLLAERR